MSAVAVLAPEASDQSSFRLSVASVRPGCISRGDRMKKREESCTHAY
jgi:hypothetical protein